MAYHNKLHIVMLPWLAFGHLIPSLELSKHLAQRGHRISFVSTPRNIARLPKLPPNLVPLISFVKLSLPNVDGLPENAEATSDVSYKEIPYLKKAFNGLEQPFARILEISPPNWIIHDFVPYRLPPIASRLGVPCAFFSPFTAAMLAFLVPPTSQASTTAHQIEYSRTKPEHFTVPPKWIPFPSDMAFRFQPLNARLLQGKKIELEIPRDDRDGSLNRDSMAESLRIVMVEKAELFKAQAREMREIFGNKTRHDQYVDDFARYLRDHGHRNPQSTKIGEKSIEISQNMP